MNGIEIYFCISVPAGIITSIIFSYAFFGGVMEAKSLRGILFFVVCCLTWPLLLLISIGKLVMNFPVKSQSSFNSSGRKKDELKLRLDGEKLDMYFISWKGRNKTPIFACPHVWQFHSAKVNGIPIEYDREDIIVVCKTGEFWFHDFAKNKKTFIAELTSKSGKTSGNYTFRTAKIDGKNVEIKYWIGSGSRIGDKIIVTKIYDGSNKEYYENERYGRRY